MASRSPATTDAAPRPPLSARLRAWRRVAVIAALLAVHVVLHKLWLLFATRSPWPHSFLRMTAWAAGIEVRVVGRPVRAHVLYAANHVSWFDIPVIASVTGARFVSKDEVERWPAVGWLAKLNRTIFIARSERGRVAEQADTLRAAIAEGTPVALFPEGGTGDGTTLRPFRAPLFSALPGSGGAMQPVALHYGDEHRLMAWNDRRGGFGAEMMRLFGLKGRRTATLTFLPAIDPAAMPDRKALAAAARAGIAGALGVEAGSTI